MDKRRVLSLFSGAGGLDLGLEGDFICLKKSINNVLHADWIKEDLMDFVRVQPTGWETVYACDIRPDAKVAWTGYFGKRYSDADERYHLESIVDVVKKAKAGEDVFPKNIDIVTGGFPCNDFSVSGKRLGFDSDKSHHGGKLDIDEPTAENRGHLYMWMRDVVSITSPKLFIAENVKGLVSLGDVKQIIEHDFATAEGDGYIVVPARVLHAGDYGVPQSRERVLFFGFKKSSLKPNALKALEEDHISEKYDPYPAPTHDYHTAGATLVPFVTVRDAFVGLKEPEKSDDPSQQKYSKAKFMGLHCQGQTEVRLDDLGPTIRAEHHGNIEYRRKTIEHGGNHFEELDAGLPERRLTVRECARIQTFPDDYVFVSKNKQPGVSSSDAYKIIGNAVPPVLAYNVAQNISTKWRLYFK